jgi:RimJ/RimL family protein N-acetyltransferase
MEATPYSGEPVESLALLFRHLTHGRYCADWTLDLKAAQRLERDQFFAYLNANAATSLLVKDGGVIVGALGMRHSDWDTQYWGFPCAALEHLYTADDPAWDATQIANILAAAADRWCEREGVAFAFARADAQNLPAVRALENSGFRYIETAVTNTFDLRKLPPVPMEGWIIRGVRPEETDTLLEIAQDAFLTHRFYADRRFARDRVDAMYREWVRTSLAGSAWTNIVLEESGRTNGFFTYRVEDLSPYFGTPFVKWRMAAISAEARGQGQGQGLRLFRGAMDYVREQASTVDSGLTVRNIRSFNLHNKLGFRVVCFSVTFHKWYR